MRTNPVERFFSPRLGGRQHGEKSEKAQECPQAKQLRDVRNHAVLAMLLGCGLRRAELVAVKIDDFELREEHWVLADLIGKGRHMRTIPVPDWVKSAVDVWIDAARLQGGTLFRSIEKTGMVHG